jgi:hypothetical protein
MNRRTLPRTFLRGGIPAAAVAALALAGTWSASATTAAYNGYDVGGDGYYEAYGFDADEDGVEDTWAFDGDRDGTIESVAVDDDGDGRPDTWGFDTDRDGYVEQVALDTTGNALPDRWGTDTDLDGAVDTIAADEGDDGYADTAEAVDPRDVPEVISVVFGQAGTWDHWSPSFGYGSGYGYDAEAAAANDAGVVTHVGDDPRPAATSTTPAPRSTPDVMVMAS